MDVAKSDALLRCFAAFKGGEQRCQILLRHAAPVIFNGDQERIILEARAQGNAKAAACVAERMCDGIFHQGLEHKLRYIKSVGVDLRVKAERRSSRCA